MGRRLRRLWPLWVVLAALLAVVLVLFLPPLLIAPYGLKDPEKRLAAENAMRTTLAGTFGGLAVIAGAIVGALNFRETGRQNRATLEQSRAVLELQRRGQVTERFSKAIEQLGQSEPDKLDVRLGAVYALEQIAQDSPELHWPIIEVLTAHLREYRRIPLPVPGAEENTAEEPEQAGLPAEAQAIATVIGRRRHKQDPPNQRLDLHKVDLSGVLWEEAQLERANLWGAQLEGAKLGGAQLEKAILAGAQLEGANLDGAQLTTADLWGALLNRASLGGTQLAGANLRAAQLKRASLGGVQLKGANLGGARLEGAFLIVAQLAGANLDEAQLARANLRGAQLKGANLIRADLEGANLRQANLEGADLTDATSLTWAQLEAARNWDQATLPAYLPRTADGGPDWSLEASARRAEHPGPGAIAITEEPSVDPAGDDQGAPSQ